MTSTDDSDDRQDWSRDQQKFAVLAWISFLTTCGFSVLFFAFLDPLTIVDALDVSALESRNAGYAVGFFFLWAHALSSGWLILRLVRRKRNWPRRP